MNERRAQALAEKVAQQFPGWHWEVAWQTGTGYVVVCRHPDGRWHYLETEEEIGDLEEVPA